MNIILWLIIGGLAGWIAGLIMRNDGFGFIGNIVIGLIGGFVGGAALGIVGLHSNGGFIGSLVTSVIGSVILLWIVSTVKRKIG